MCHIPRPLKSKMIIKHTTTPLRLKYKIIIPPNYHYTWRGRPIEITLIHLEKNWVGVLPYSKWANHKTIHIACNENGEPQKFIRYVGYIPHPLFKKVG